MTTLSTVEVDRLPIPNFPAHWMQPCLTADLTNDWFVTGVDNVTRRVDRTKITAKAYYCTVPTGDSGAGGGPLTFTVDKSGPPTANPAFAGSIPTLSSFYVAIAGQNGQTYVGLCTDTSQEVVLRTGAHRKIVRRWTNVTNVIDPGFPFGVHTYLTFDDNLAGCIPVDVMISNSSIVIGNDGAWQYPGTINQGNPTSSAYGHAYFTASILRVPVGYSIVWERGQDVPGGSSSLIDAAPTHMWHPQKAAYARRGVLYPTSLTNGLSIAQAILSWRGLGIPRTGRSYHNTEAYGAANTLLPNMGAIDFSPNLDGSDVRNLYPGYRTFYDGQYNTLRGHLRNGTYGAHGGGVEGYPLQPPCGPFNQTGSLLDGANVPSGSGIASHAGIPNVREYLRYCRLRCDADSEGQAYWVVHRTTGKPVTTREFGQASLGTTHYDPRWPNSGWSNPNVVGWQPFRMSDFEYEGDGSTIPGMCGSGTADHNLAYNPTDKPLNVGIVTFQAPATFATLDLMRHPEVGSHMCRYLKYLKPLIWQAGDALAIDRAIMQGEWWRLMYSEQDTLPAIHGNPATDLSAYDYPWAAGHGARQRWEHALILPNMGSPGYGGRAVGWTLEILATRAALAQPLNASVAEIAALQLLLQYCRDWIVTMALPCGATGFFEKNVDIDGNGSPLNKEPWVTPPCPNDIHLHGESFPPPDWQHAKQMCMAYGIEMPICMHGLWCAMEQGGHSVAGDALIVRNGEEELEKWDLMVTGEYPDYAGCVAPSPFIFGVAKYQVVAETFSPGSGGQYGQIETTFTEIPGTSRFKSGETGSINWLCMIEYYYRLKGTPHALKLAYYIGYRPLNADALSFSQRASQMLQNIGEDGFSGGTCAYLQGFSSGVLPATAVALFGETHLVGTAAGLNAMEGYLTMTPVVQTHIEVDAFVADLVDLQALVAHLDDVQALVSES